MKQWFRRYLEFVFSDEFTFVAFTLFVVILFIGALVRLAFVFSQVSLVCP